MKLEIEGTQAEIENFCLRIALGADKERAAEIASEIGAAFGGEEARPVHDEIVSLVRGGNLIGAIKIYRRVMGASLLDSKHAIDALKADLGIR